MKTVSGSLKLKNHLIVLLAGALLLAVQLATPLLSALAPAGERLPLPTSADSPAPSTADSRPGVAHLLAANRVASAELAGVLGGASFPTVDTQAPAPQALRLEWASYAPAPYADATSVRLVELLTNQPLGKKNLTQGRTDAKVLKTFASVR